MNMIFLGSSEVSVAYFYCYRICMPHSGNSLNSLNLQFKIYISF